MTSAALSGASSDLPAQGPDPATASLVRLAYRLPQPPAHWELSEDETMPESHSHHTTVLLLELLLKAWAARDEQPWLVGSNLAIRWNPAYPNVGVDPDVYLAPWPPEGDQVESLRLWQPGHRPPRLAIEVVSPRYGKKNYEEAPDKYALSGTDELWVFDPHLAGPKKQGGPYRLQLWCRNQQDFERVYAGAGPAFSPTLQAWAFPTQQGRTLRIADDPQGTRLWLTDMEAEQAARHQALKRVADLEAELEQLKQKTRSRLCLDHP